MNIVFDREIRATAGENVHHIHVWDPRGRSKRGCRCKLSPSEIEDARIPLDKVHTVLMCEQSQRIWRKDSERYAQWQEGAEYAAV